MTWLESPWALVAAILVGALARLLPRLFRLQAIPSDTFFHLYFAGAIRENRFRIPEQYPRVLLPHEVTYPFLYHLLLACFPGRARLWAERVSPAFFDAGTTAVTAAFTHWLVVIEGWPPELPFFATLLCAISPGVLRVGSGPGVYSGSPRPMGRLLFTIHIVSTYLALRTANVAWLAVAIVAGAAVLIGAKFGTQVLVFFGLMFSVGVSGWYPIVLLACLTTALAVTRGRAWKVLAGQVRHSKFYYKYLQRVYLRSTAETARNYVEHAADALKGLAQGRLRHALGWYLTDPFFPHLLVTVFPEVIVAAVVATWNPTDATRFLGVWLLAGVLSFLLTRWEPLLFLGESERYLEYSLLPATVLSLRALLSEGLQIVWAWVGFSGLLLVLYGLRYVRNAGRQTAAQHKMMDYLDALPSGVVFPIGSLHWLTLYSCTRPVLTHGCNFDERLVSHEEFQRIYSRYPYPGRRLSYVVERFRVRYLLIERAQCSHYRSKLAEDPSELEALFELEFEAAGLLLFRVRKDPTGACPGPS